MGIPGLFSFMDNNEDRCYDKYILKNVPIVVDGCSIAAHIAIQCGATATFGGDYDKIGQRTARIFNTFLRCGVVPVVIFDGASESKKLKTTITRLTSRVIGVQKVTPGHRSSYFFPTMLRITVKAKLKEMGITVLQSDFEADREIAAVAKQLNDAPVLTNDSDFFIFDVPFIPLNSIEFRVTRSIGLPCKIYRQSKLVHAFQLKDPKALLLLPIIRGNDYMNSFYFINFLENIPKYRNSNKSVSQKSIKSFLSYLKNETYDSALAKMMNSVPQQKRKLIKKIIKKIILGYTDMSTTLVDYISSETLHKINSLSLSLKALNDTFGHLTLSDDAFDDENISDEESDVEVEDDKLEEEDELEGEQEEEEEELEGEQEEEEEDNEDDVDVELSDEEQEEVKPGKSPKHQAIQSMPNWFLNLSRSGRVDQDILTLINIKLYFNDPQVENYSLPCAGEVVIPLMQFIAGIALGESNFNFWSRKGNSYKSVVLATSHANLYEKIIVQKPSLNFISEHRKIMLKFFNVNATFMAKFPEEWKLYSLAIIYWVKNSKIAKLYHIHAVILTMVISIMESRIGDFKFASFLKRKALQIRKVKENRKKVVLNTKNICTVKNAQRKVEYEDCLLMAEPISNFFKLDPAVRKSKITSKKFTLPVVHTFSEFQSCLKATLMLNDILRHCFKPTDVTKLFNGTFLYNVAAYLKYKKNVVKYIMDLFTQNGAPSLAMLYISLYENLKEFAPQISCEDVISKKQQKQNLKKEMANIDKLFL